MDGKLFRLANESKSPSYAGYSLGLLELLELPASSPAFLQLPGATQFALDQ
jgi:hypothetical protein